MRIPIALALLLASTTAHATEPASSAAPVSASGAAPAAATGDVVDRSTVGPAATAPTPSTPATTPAVEPSSHRPHRAESRVATSATQSDRAHGRRAHRHEPPPRPPSASLGYANSGRLVNPSRLEEDDTLRYVPGRPLHYGTDELIGLIRRSARSVFRRHHTRLSVGDLSAAGGGPVGHHASHQSGRDADIGFYITNTRGEPVLLDDYVSFRRDGMPFVNGPYRFDTVRNWSFIEALLTDPSITVEHVFVSNGLRSLLIHYARNHGVDASVVARAEATLHQPPRGSPHTNHFHVRIACPSGDASCVEGVHRVLRRRRHPHAVAQRGRAVGPATHR